jgi:tRNA (cytidine/uridine-2'-O-)-methyltransferase
VSEPGINRQNIEKMPEIALYQPDIAANTGTIARLCACLGLKLTIIEPAGFVWDDAKLQRAGMDYLDRASISRSPSWEQFQTNLGSRRVVLLTTKTPTSYLDFAFRRDDILLLGRESAGVPEAVHLSIAQRITIPMQQGTRSLNVALACAMVTGEALRQTRFV